MEWSSWPGFQFHCVNISKIFVSRKQVFFVEIGITKTAMDPCLEIILLFHMGQAAQCLAQGDC